MELRKTIPQPIDVRPEDRTTWQRLLMDAYSRGLTATEDRVFPPKAGTVHYLLSVTSFSEPGREYFVRIDIPANIGGRAYPTVDCECKAGQVGTKCTHAALALQTANLWPRGMVITRQPGTEETDERWEYRTGEWALIVGTEQRGVVSGIRGNGERPEYRLDDPDLHAPLGWYVSYELTPAAKPQHVHRVDPAMGIAILTGRRAS